MRNIQRMENPYDVYMHGHTSGHEINDFVIKQLPELLRVPVLVIEDETHNLRAIVDKKDDKGDYIMCHITLDRVQNRYNVNIVSTIYGRREVAEYIKSAFEKKCGKSYKQRKS